MNLPGRDRLPGIGGIAWVAAINTIEQNLEHTNLFVPGMTRDSTFDRRSAKRRPRYALCIHVRPHESRYYGN